jgi:hypothetical protein
VTCKLVDWDTSGTIPVFSGFQDGTAASAPL